MIKITKISNRLDREKILILVDGWSSYESLYYLMRESLPGEFGYIQYAYPDKILCPDPIKTKENFLHLVSTITKDLNKLDEKRPRSFYMYGQSLGGLFCMIVSDKIRIQKVMLIVPGCNLAESFWFGERTQEIKNQMINKHNVTLPLLKKEWREISPDNYFKKKSHETEFSLVLSKVDKVIPISNGKKLLKLLREDKIKYTKSWTNLSHQFEMLEEGIFMSHFRKWISTFK